MWQDTKSTQKINNPPFMQMIKKQRKKSEKHHLAQQPQITEYLGVILTKEGKDLLDKNFNFLKIEDEKDIRKWKDLPCSWIDRINRIKMQP